MADAGRSKPLERSAFFDDGRSSRHIVPGTVARGQLHEDDHFHTGRIAGKLAVTFPFALTREDLRRGRERYGIFCTPCHDQLGNGLGMVVRRGYRQPPSFHIDRLRQAAPGHFFDSITNGFGAMPAYAAQIPARDRWLITAWIRTLQLSQHARLEDATEEGRRMLLSR
jgi:hypothetical protein